MILGRVDMSIRQHATLARGCRWLAGTLVSAAAMMLVVAPGIARAGSGETGAAGSGRVRAMAADDLNLQKTWVQFFNGRKWDELGGIYEEDAIALPPNHEPIQGRAAIVEYFKSIRDAFDGVNCGEPARVTVSGNLVSLAGANCSAYGGRMGFTYSELYERQADGSLRYRVDMFGMR
jgi:ketosteroid isomerase-like protein